jgi:hypothetical protein
MCRRVDAARHSTLNDEPADCQIDRQALGHACTVGRRMTPPNYCDPRQRQDVDRAAHVEHDRRVIDLLETRRVRTIVDCNNTNPSGDRAGGFFLSQFQGLTSAERLR